MSKDTLPAQKIEPILFKLACTDSKYLTLLLKNFKKDWLEDKSLGTVLNGVLNYYKSKNCLPSRQIVKLLASKAFPDDYNILEQKLDSIFETVIIDDSEKPYIDEQILSYLINVGSYHTIFKAIDKIEQKDRNLSDIIEQWKDILSISFDSDLGTDYLENIEAHCTRLLNPDRKLTFGFSQLDLVTNGGMLRDGRFLGIFMAPPGVGKSLWLSNVSSQLMKHNKFVVIISLEMSEDVYSERIDAQLSEVNINKLSDNLQTLKNTCESYKEKYPLSKLVIKEFPPDSITCGHIKTYLDSLISKIGRMPDAILIDYMSLLLPMAKTSSEGSFWRGGAVAREVRALSYFYKCPFLTAAQTNRSGMVNAEPSLEQISESSAPLMVADFIAGIFQRDGEKELGVMNLIILKNRLGGLVGKVLQFMIDYTTLKLSDSQNVLDDSTIKSVQNEFANEINILNNNL